MRKSMLFIIAIAVCCIALASNASARCCMNPGAPSIVICQDASLETCCPQPENSFVEYYSVPEPKGPATFDSCQNNFFSASQECNSTAIATGSCREGCCCYPKGEYTESKEPASEAECISLNGVFASTFPEATCQEHCGAFKPTPPEGCTDPKPGNLIVVNRKGDKAVELSWTNPCNADSFTISRCEGADCSNFQVVAGPTKETKYYDFSINLKWGLTYVYKVTASYPMGDFSDSRSVELGDIECWEHYDETAFCLFSMSYELEPYRRYLVQYEGFSNDTNAFRSKVNETFGSRFNNAYSCDSSNRLSGILISCDADRICTIRKGQPMCVAETVCRTSGKPFSLFNTKEACENAGLNYCFFDRSYTTVDDCYDCMPFMSCYDYKSERACTANNCGAGNCTWTYTNSELKTGVCIDLSKDNCKWCDTQGTPGMENLESYNYIFDRCTPEKRDALSALKNCNVLPEGPSAEITVE